MKHLDKKQIILIFTLIFIVVLGISALFTNNDEIIKSSAFSEEEEAISVNTMIVEPLTQDIKIIRPAKNKITTGEKKITFMGMADPSMEVKINNEIVDVYFTGNFVFEKELKVGNNTFEFKMGDKTLSYEVIRENNIIQSIVPSDTIQVESGMEVNIRAYVHSNLKVYAKINGEVIDLKQLQSDSAISARDTTYAEYSGVYVAPEVKGNTNLGKVKVYAINNGEEVCLEGAEVKVNPKRNDIGAALIIADSARVYNGNNISYTPLVNEYPLPKNTALNITSEVKVGDKAYYKLESGQRIRKEDAKVISRINNKEDKVSNIHIFQEENKTILKIKKNSKLPYSLKLLGVDFEDEEKEKYTVKEYSPSSLEMKFLYCNSIDNNIKIDDNNLIQKGTIKDNSLTLDFKKDKKYIGHFAYYDGEDNLIIEFRNEVKSLKDMTIVIDPGHGLIKDEVVDSGALGFSNLNENKINYDMAKKLMGKLKEKGANVVLLDTEKKAYPLKDRGSEGRNNNADLYISIHNNSGGSGKYNATETYYYTPYSKAYAENINNELVKLYSKQLFKGNEKEYNRGHKYNDFTVTLERENPSVLVEVGYMDNPISFNAIINSLVQERVADSIIKGIEKSIK